MGYWVKGWLGYRVNEIEGIVMIRVKAACSGFNKFDIAPKFALPPQSK